MEFRPYFFYGSGPLESMSTYLYDILRPAYDCVPFANAYIDTLPIIYQLETYQSKGLLKPTTQLITVEMNEWQLSFDHEQMLICLEKFFYLYSPTSTYQIKELSFDTILKLIRLILRLQYTIYNDNLYQQTRGANIDSPLIQLLVNISLYCWQQTFMTCNMDNKEIECR